MGIENGPTGVIPAHFQNLEPGFALVARIVGVEDKIVPVVEAICAVMTDARPVRVASKQQRTPALGQIAAVFVEIGARDALAAADHDFVRTVDAATTIVP